MKGFQRRIVHMDMKDAKEKSKGFMKEFKEFISKGNVIDLAVGIIIGSAFTAIVKSLVNDIIMPVIGLITGGTGFENLKVVLTPASEGVEEVAIRYGSFIQQIVDFLIVAFVIFSVIKTMNRFRRKKEDKPAAPTDEVVLLTEIRDMMKEGR
jgi:large conductance mechanosensitive channel